MHAAATIIVDLFIIFVAARLAGVVFTLIKQPPVVGELLAGILIGPFALGLVGIAQPALIEDFQGQSESAQEALDLALDTFATLGAVILLFYVGLETRLSDLLHVGWRAILVGTLGTIVPFAAGYALMALQGASPAATLFVATSLVATSVGITARVLEDLGLLHSRETRIILGAAVIDDIIALLLLVIVSDLAILGAFHPLNIGLIAGQALVFSIGVLLIGTRMVHHFSARLSGIPIPYPVLNVALAVMLGLSAAATLTGLSAIIGAFLAGLVFAQENERHQLKGAVLPLYHFLVPFFFVIIGTRLDPALFLDTRIAGAALLITAVAIVAKLVGAGIGTIGMDIRSAAIVGVGMVPRGEVGLIVAGIGLAQGLITRDLFSVVVIMSMVTTLIVPPALTWLSRPHIRRPALIRGKWRRMAGRHQAERLRGTCNKQESAGDDGGRRSER